MSWCDEFRSYSTLGDLSLTRATETVKERTSFAENAGVLAKVIDEHNVAVQISNL